MGLSPFGPPGTLRSGGTQSFKAPRYPGDWWDSVLSGPQVPWGLAGLSPFRPPGTLGTGEISSVTRSGTLGTGGSVLSAPQVPLGRLFSPIPSISFALFLQHPPFRNSDQPLYIGSHSGHYPPSPLRCVPSSFVATTAQPLIPSSTWVGLGVHTLRALSHF